MPNEGTIRVDDEIVLRPASVNDAREMFALIDSNRHHLRWSFRSDQAVSVEDVEAWARPAELTGRIGGFVERRGALVGNVSLRFLDGPDHGTADFGFFLSEDAQGAGIVTRACRVLARLAFDEHRIHRVTIRTARENHRSRAVAERLGFVFEGYQREAIRLGDGHHDSAVYSLLSHERERLS